MQNNRIKINKDDKSTHWDLHCTRTCSASCLDSSFPPTSEDMNDSEEHLFISHNSFIRVFKVSIKLGKLLVTEQPRAAYNKAELWLAFQKLLMGCYSFEHTEQCPDDQSVCYEIEIVCMFLI